MSLHNLEMCDVGTKAQGMNKPETNLLDGQSQKRFGAEAQLRLTQGYQLDHVCNNQKLLNSKGLNTTLSLDYLL